MPTLMNSSRLQMAMTAGRAMGPFSGKKTGGMTPPRLPKKTNTNSVVRYGRNRSPSRPMTSSTIWPRTKSTTDSIPFCSPDGTSRGLRKAKKNSPQTSSTTRNICSTTRLMLRSTPATSRWTMSGHWKISMPGAWKPSRSAASGSVSAVMVAPSAAAVALDDQVEGAGHAEQDADRHQVLGAEPPVEQPADPAPGEHAGDQGADDRPDHLGTAAGWLPWWPGIAHGRANLSSRPRLLLVGDHIRDPGPHGEADLGRQVDHGPGDQGEGERLPVEGGRVPGQEKQQPDHGHLEGEGQHGRRQHQLGLDPAGRPHRQQGGREEGDGQHQAEGGAQDPFGAGRPP